jgi:hypothetical protein
MVFILVHVYQTVQKENVVPMDAVVLVVLVVQEKNALLVQVHVNMIQIVKGAMNAEMTEPGEV